MKGNQSMRNDSRGQLILVGGVVVATLLITLVLILNGVLFTENFSTRDQPQAIDRVVDTGGLIEGTASEVIDMENSERYESRGDTAQNVDRDIQQVSQSLSERRFEAHGETLNIEVNNVQDAWTVVQTDEGEFQAAESGFGFDNVYGWEIATADGIRDSHTTVTSAREMDPSNTSEASRTFQLEVTGSSSDWSVWIFEHPSRNTIALGTTVDSDGNPVVECESDDGTADIDWNEMTIDGNDCPFKFAEGVGEGPYELRFHEGDEITGTYKFVLGRGPGTEIGLTPVTGERTVPDTTKGDSTVADEPAAYDGVYSTTVTVSTAGEDLTADSVFFTAPRQPGNTTSGEKP
jgi:hypothetical protein